MIYLDNAATTRRYAQSELVGNPSAPYLLGRRAAYALNDARETIANLLHAQPKEIILTSGGSESDNLAIKGAAFANQDRGNHIITTQIEHSAVYNSCKWLEKHGFRVTYLPVTDEGFVLPEQVASAITDQTILISIMLANNEIGSIQPIKQIKQVIGDRNILLHTDAVQAFTQIPIDVNDLGVDLLSISGHKFHGPKGTGALYVREGTKLDPLIHGGSQELGLRAGTENVEGFVEMADAAKEVTAYPELIHRMEQNRDILIKQLLQRIPGAFVNGTIASNKRLPNNCNICIPDVPAEVLIIRAEMKQLYISTGSACTSGDLQPSRVLKAIGLTDEEALSSIRLTLTEDTSLSDIMKAADILVEAANEIRETLQEKR